MSERVILKEKTSQNRLILLKNKIKNFKNRLEDYENTLDAKIEYNKECSSEAKKATAIIIFWACLISLVIGICLVSLILGGAINV